MPLKHLPAAAAAAGLALLALDARAGASLSVDDAALTPPGHCQVESWARLRASGHELTAVPACHWRGTEFGLGLSHLRPSAGGSTATLGAKRLLRDTDHHGIGVALGAAWNGNRQRIDSWSAHVPASIALDADRRTVMHANLGWNRPRGLRGAATGGIGIERTLTGDWTLLAEAYGDHRGGRGAQCGARRSLGARASLDLLVGRQRGAAGPWVTVGFNVLFPH